jgi:hypothetical protein
MAKKHSDEFLSLALVSEASLILLLVFVFQACHPNHGNNNFSVVQVWSPDSGGNVVVLNNRAPSVLTVWDYGFGKSYLNHDTLRFALAGTYSVTAKAFTATDTLGPFTQTIEVKRNNFKYVNNPIWDNLTGGYGKKKSWILDMDQTHFQSPLYFAGTSIGWNQQDAYGCIGNECWWWAPTFEKEPWIMERINHGKMIFSLSDSARLFVEKPAEGKTLVGTFMLDTAKKILTTHGTAPLHSPNWESNVSNWSRSQIITSNEHLLQLAFLRDQNNPDKEVQLVFNYISEEYYNKKLQLKERTKPSLQNSSLTAEQIIGILAGKPGQSKAWVLNQDWPIDWTDGEGNGWTNSLSPVREWAWTEDCTNETRDATLVFSNREGTLHFSLDQFSQTCTSVVNLFPEKQELSIGDCPLIQLRTSWLPTKAPVLKWVKGSPSSYTKEGIWLGINTKPDEYLAFHLVLKK